MKSKKLLLMVVVSALLAGCEKPPPPPPLKPVAKDKLNPPTPAVPEAAAPGAPPPPAVPAEVAATVAAVPPPPGSGNSLGAATVAAGTDVLFYFRKDSNGNVRNDLEALQEAVTSYDRRAGLSTEADKPAWPVMKDLSDMVKVGMLKALPAAPAGQKYAYDTKSGKVSLVNQ